jgi:hypothetical protein
MLRNDALLVFPTLGEGACDGGLQVPSVMVVHVPRTARLMEAAGPKHRLRNELEAELQAFVVPGRTCSDAW